ncbi:MAG: tetratricopeptide repeat protein, partial [Kangiellaceae bacterium]|nr:tetratricopeptide repeat protein [Kangiellaceae bacterium]
LSDNLTEKNLADAKESFEQAIKLEPTFGKAYAGLCRTFAYSHDYFSTSSSELLKNAEESCNKARKLAPGLIESYISQAILYRETSNYEQAIQLLEIALSKNPNNVDTLLEFGQTYRLLQDLEKCEEYLLLAIELQPGNAKIYNQLGLAYLFFGAIDRAKNMFEKTIELDPNNISGFNNLGTLYMFETKFEQADFYFRRSIELDPKASTYSNRASVLYYLGRFEEALPYYQRVVSLSDTDHFNWSSLADCYLQLGNDVKANEAYANAIKHAEAELKNSPKDITTLNMLGYYYARVGEIEKAKSYRDLSLASSPEDMYIYYYASLINMILGEKDKAISDLQTAVNKGFDTKLIRVAPELADLRRHSSFLELVNNEKIN